jgi:class I fructose-bisphosphate aldolase
VNVRLNRLFAADGKCFDVAVDHGFFGEGRFLVGIEDMDRTIGVLVEAAPDAIQLSPGHAPLLQRIPGPRKPALVLRTDVANVYGPEIGGPEAYYFSELVAGAVELALRLDAACAVCNLLQIPGQPELLHACIQNVAALRAECDPVGMPLMVEPLVMQPGSAGYTVDGDVEKIVALVRQAVELGADIIKADPTDDLDLYPRVIEVAGGRPVLVRGGGRAPDKELLRRTEALMATGAAGIVYGRNVIQHKDPAAMTRALMAVVHDGVTADEALALLRASGG